MSDIPADIMQSAEAVHIAILGKGASLSVVAIALALLTERQSSAALIKELVEALEGFKLQPEMVVGAQAGCIILRIPDGVFGKASAALAKAKERT